MKQKVLVGMSGGVDSSVCAALLKNDGYEVLGITLDLFGDTYEGQRDAKSVCDALGIDHTVKTLKNEFKGFVIDDFINEYINGRTPNPCIVCNRTLCKIYRTSLQRKGLGSGFRIVTTLTRMAE